MVEDKNAVLCTPYPMSRRFKMNHDLTYGNERRHHMKKITVNNEERAVPSGAVGRREKDPGKGCLDGRRAGMDPSTLLVLDQSWKTGETEHTGRCSSRRFRKGHGVPATQYTFQSPFFQL